MAKLNICDIENGAVGTEFNLTPKGCFWQDQTTFFKLAKAAFKLTSSPRNDSLSVRLAQYGEISRDCGRSEDNLYLSGSRRRRDGQLRKEDSFKDWMFSRPLALRPIYWEISSDAYTYFKMEYETELNTEIFGVRRFQILD